MSKSVALAAAAALTIVGLAGPSVAADKAAPAACNRACLEGFMTRYLDAMFAHDAKRVPVTANFRRTENTIPLKLGDGAWRTMSGRGDYAFTIADPKTGQVGTIATLRENGRPVLASIRLRVTGGKISEAEEQILRNEGSATSEEALKVSAVWNTALTAGQRVSRERMIYAANQYFSGIVAMDGNIVPFDERCRRIENGNITANNPNRRPTTTGGFNVGPLNCTGNISAKLWTYITDVTHRRHNFVDEERGVVWSQVIFPHEGGIMSYYQPGYGTLDMSAAAKRPFDTHIAELFKVESGKITQIEAVILSTPYGMDDGGWTKAPAK